MAPTLPNEQKVMTAQAELKGEPLSAKATAKHSSILLSKRVVSVKTWEEDIAPSSKLYGRLPAPDNLSPSSNEAMVSSVLQHNVGRLYLSIARTWAPFGKALIRVATWQNKTASASWAVLYATMWYLNVLLPALFAFFALFLVFPTFFEAPIFAIFKSTSKEIAEDARQTEQDAALLADEVDSMLDNSFATEVTRAEEQLNDQPKLERTNSFASTMLQTVSSPLKAPLGLRVRWTDRIRRHGQPIQVVTGTIADVHERAQNMFAPAVPKGPRLKFAAIFAAISILLYFATAHMLARCTSAFIGLALFGGQPFAKSNPELAQYLNLQRSLYLGVPTNAQLVFSQLQANPLLLSTIPEPKVKAETTEGQVEAPAPAPTSRAAKFTGYFKTAVDLAERSSEMATGQKAISFANLRSLARGEDLPLENFGVFSCFANYDSGKGNLTITADHIHFYRGIHIKRHEAPTPYASFELKLITAVKKIQSWQAADGLGLQGIGDGLEITLEDKTCQAFYQVRKRDEAFLRILVACSQYRKWVLA